MQMKLSEIAFGLDFDWHIYRQKLIRSLCELSNFEHEEMNAEDEIRGPSDTRRGARDNNGQ